MKRFSAFLFALALMAVWTGAAFADATPYASARFATFYKDVDGQNVAADTQDLVFDLQTNSRLGVKFKNDALLGVFELAARPGNITLRHAYGTYDFGAGVFLAGQTERPYAYFASTVVENDGNFGGYGTLNDRLPQLRLALKSGPYVALLKNKGANNQADEMELPELVVGFNGTAAAVDFGVHAAYTQVELNATNEADGYLLAANAKTTLGSVGLLARLFYGQNLSAMGLAEGLVAPTATQDYASYGGWLEAQFKLSDMMAIIGGVGYNNTEAGATGNLDNDQIAYFIQAPIKIAKGFTVVPEIALFDKLDDAGNASAATTDGSVSTYVGAKWQFDF